MRRRVFIEARIKCRVTASVSNPTQSCSLVTLHRRYVRQQPRSLLEVTPLAARQTTIGRERWRVQWAGFATGFRTSPKLQPEVTGVGGVLRRCLQTRLGG